MKHRDLRKTRKRKIGKAHDILWFHLKTSIIRILLAKVSPSCLGNELLDLVVELSPNALVNDSKH